MKLPLAITVVPITGPVFSSEDWSNILRHRNQQTALISKDMATNLKQLQTRLNKGSLTASDVKELNALIANALGSSKGRKTLGGRPIIASLPGGLDVVK